MFNYRHFIELAIKSSIGKLGIKPDNIHFIDILFEKLEKLWIERTANIDKDFWININFDYGIDLTEQFTKLKNKIEKISKIDKNSTCFRYPQFDRKEIKICLNEVEKDLLCFQDFFENLSWAIFKLEEFNQ